MSRVARGNCRVVTQIIQAADFADEILAKLAVSNQNMRLSRRIPGSER